MSVRAGDVVRLTEEYKVQGTYHGRIYGQCVGDVIGPTRVGSSYVDVRWRPSGILFTYDPDDLEVVDARCGG